MDFRSFVVIDSDKQQIVQIILENFGIISVFDLFYRGVGIRIALEFDNHRRIIRILRDETDIRKTVSGMEFLYDRVL